MGKAKMYFRITSSRYKNKVYRHLRLVESFWDHTAKKRRNRLIKNFGNIDTLPKGQLQRLLASLARFVDTRFAQPHELTARAAKLYGEVLLARAVWDRLGLPAFLGKHARATNYRADVHLLTLIMVLNRLIKPKSDLGLSEWYTQLYLPELQNVERPIGVQHFYRTLDFLHRIREPLQRHLYDQVTDLFNLEVDVIFYDLTSTYVYTGDDVGIRRFGHSRDRRGDLRQILLGLVTTKEGFPIAYQIFPGNRADCTTVPDVVRDLEKQFKIRQVVFVADSGMFSARTVRELEREEYRHKYILGIRTKIGIGSQLLDPNLEHYEVIEKAEDGTPALYVKDIVSPNAPRYVVCYNPEEARRDAHYREALIQKALARLERTQETIRSKRFRSQKQIQSALTKIFTHETVRKFFTYSYTKKQGLQYEINRAAVERDTLSDGVFILRTTVYDLPSRDIVASYKNLLRVENAFREIKNFLRIRPIYHHRDDRLSAHVGVCVLAYLIERIIEHTLHSAGQKISARKALETVHKIQMVENDLAGTTVYCITAVDKPCRDILGAFGIKIKQRTFVSG